MIVELVMNISDGETALADSDSADDDYLDGQFGLHDYNIKG